MFTLKIKNIDYNFSVFAFVSQSESFILLLHIHLIFHEKFLLHISFALFLYDGKKFYLFIFNLINLGI